MKKFINKVSVLMMGCMIAFMATACHTGGDDDSTQKVTTTPKNSLRGVILDQNGATLTGATVKINNKTVNINGNTFESTGLGNGNYKVEVTKAGYKGAEETITLSTSSQVVDNEVVLVGQDVESTFYLIKEETETINLGAEGDEKSVTLETSTQDDGTGKIVGNTQDPNDASLNSEIVVTAKAPGLSASEVSTVEKQLPAGKNIQDVYFKLTNLGSLEEATSKTGKTRSLIVAGESLPENYTYFAGVKLEAPYKVDFSSIAGFFINISIDLPGDVKNAIKLFRNTGSGWTEVTSSTTGNGIAKVDNSQATRITVSLNKLETQSFAIGVQIEQDEPSISAYTFNGTPVVNTSSSAITVKNMPYTVKSHGIVLTNKTKGAMVDYLRKIIVRYYKIRAIYEAKDETRTYNFTNSNTGGYSLPVNGELYLTGFQNVTVSEFSIRNGESRFQAEEYGDVYVYPYAIVPISPIHSGGSND
ncbi:hypothetical protein SAMN04488494_0782 [Xylanibacter ruminicola]|uniref:Carboxypeptidase regulatory-like domain-containing protein n=1 Tax=Xylanibacter ruminicola TaxID=839 RepID=A0A1M7DM42_XYLRU|nr:carboxypeptidase-like regulatory domain-containing protein [Xylanibacter ruminicola]SFB94671.1 hypothetical protein SAMN04488493_102290 [Xylanibacter ruminicola]SHL80581.1 hypothetical protein SAMN04488494_0782 [Xylanibacter ruminicola]